MTFTMLDKSKLDKSFRLNELNGLLPNLFSIQCLPDFRWSAVIAILIERYSLCPTLARSYLISRSIAIRSIGN